MEPDPEQQKAQINRLMAEAETAAERVKRSEDSFKSLIAQAHHMLGFEPGGDRSNLLNQILGAAYALGNDAGQSSEIVMHQREEITLLEKLMRHTDEQTRRQKERDERDDAITKAREERDLEHLEIAKKRDAIDAEHLALTRRQATALEALAKALAKPGLEAE